MMHKQFVDSPFDFKPSRFLDEEGKVGCALLCYEEDADGLSID